jgi:hypothetical protein
MAREAGFMDADKNGVWITDGYWDDELRRFADLLAAPIIEAAMKSAEKAVEVAITLEREACAKVCETFYNHEAKDCADAIRARGEHYPCKPDIFEMTYERVEE